MSSLYPEPRTSVASSEETPARNPTEYDGYDINEIEEDSSNEMLQFLHRDLTQHRTLHSFPIEDSSSSPKEAPRAQISEPQTSTAPETPASPSPSSRLINVDGQDQPFTATNDPSYIPPSVVTPALVHDIDDPPPPEPSWFTVGWVARLQASFHAKESVRANGSRPNITNPSRNFRRQGYSLVREEEKVQNDHLADTWFKMVRDTGADERRMEEMIKRSGVNEDGPFTLRRQE